MMEQRADDHHNHHVLEIDEEIGKQINEELGMQINEKLYKLSPIPSERCIFKVHETLRNSNVKAYEPQVVAIGPYHRARYDKNPHLLPMEERKLRNLKQLLERRNETSAESYVVAMRELEEKARKFYAEPISLSTNEFVEMMLLDGCFIIELLRNNIEKILGLSGDPVFQLSHVWCALKRDLLLFENQLPHFILERLYNMTTTNNPYSSPDHIIPMVLAFFLNTVQLDDELILDGVNQIKDHTHLLSLVHYYTCYPFNLLKQGLHPNQLSAPERFNIKPATRLQEAEIEFKKFEPAISDGSRATTLRGQMHTISKILYKFNGINGVLQIFHPLTHTRDSSLPATDLQEAGFESKEVEKRSCTCYPFKLLKPAFDPSQLSYSRRFNIKPASELQEAGVEFKKVKERNFLDIRFQNGRMEIPTFVVADETESLFRNFIAYEQYLPENELRCFSNYTHIIDCLVNSSKDVAILRDLGIVDNLMGDDEVVSSMLNKLGDGVYLGNIYKCYGQLYDDVRKHCSRRRNRWLAKLRKDYFNSPWAIISFVAALVLLLLTVTQTVFSIHPVV